MLSSLTQLLIDMTLNEDTSPNAQFDFRLFDMNFVKAEIGLQRFFLLLVAGVAWRQRLGVQRLAFFVIAGVAWG